jgi:serine/threonine-protein kinase
MVDVYDGSELDRPTAGSSAQAAGHASAGSLRGAEPGAFALGGPQRGQRLGPYLLVERLGGGAMATVYRAVDQRNNRAVAVKVLRPDADAIMRERFRREAETHSNLNHPNIVQILDIGQDAGSGLTYIAMELVDGPNLSEVMESVVRLPPAAAARILEPIAAALDYSCRQGVIHRDVKPSNVLLRRVHADTPNAVQIEGLDVPVLPLLSDFGIARALDAPELTSAGRTIGTPTYMSPEQCADSHEIDGRSDLYSLGAVFYRCVVGRPPFGGTTTQILHAHVYDPLTIPDSLLAELPPVAVQLLQRSLAKDPNLRYADGAQMAADLHLLTSSTPPPVVGRTSGTGEATATMPALPAVIAPPPVNGQTVLVPGPEATVAPAVDATAPLYIPGESLPRVITPLSVPAVEPRRRWIGAVLGGVLAAFVLIFGGGLALNLLPDDILRPAPPATVALLPDSTTGAITPPAATGAVTAETPTAQTVTAIPVAAATSATLAMPAADATPVASPLAGASPTAQPLPTPVGDVRSFWADAEAAYQDGDWRNALEFLTVVRRIEPGYQGETGDQMLFESRVGLAAGAIAAGELDKALEHLNAAVALRPDASRVEKIQAALQALLAPGTLNIQMARWTLATALGSYARELINAENACAAADQLQAAVTLSPQTSSAQLLAEAQAACEQARRAAGVRRELAQLDGRLLYSTQEGDVYRIYRVGTDQDAASALLIENGAQPARQGSGTLVALRNTGGAQPGIALFDLSAGLAPTARTLQLTTDAGDAHDAPPSWSSDDRTLVFGSTAPAEPTHLYRSEVGAAEPPLDLGLGRDPAWSPDQDRIVFNGVNEQGGEPGLWLMNSDGSNRLRLTDNGNDIRPVWTPDGLAVVFMSLRDGDWEVYRLDLLTEELLRLTDSPAQDGLPTVSPDGGWVAFASDRGGFWRIWVVPSAGGEAQPLVTINGVLTNWLEHAIQWIP